MMLASCRCSMGLVSSRTCLRHYFLTHKEDLARKYENLSECIETTQLLDSFFDIHPSVYVVQGQRNVCKMSPAKITTKLAVERHGLNNGELVCEVSRESSWGKDCRFPSKARCCAAWATQTTKWELLKCKGVGCRWKMRTLWSLP